MAGRVKHLKQASPRKVVAQVVDTEVVWEEDICTVSGAKGRSVREEKDGAAHSFSRMSFAILIGVV